MNAAVSPDQSDAAGLDQSDEATQMNHIDMSRIILIHVAIYAVCL